MASPSPRLVHTAEANSSPGSFAKGLVLGLAGVLLLVLLFARLLPVNATTAGFLFLLLVLGVATAYGFAPSALVSLAAMLAFNFFFLPPLGQFTIADPENWVALFAFLVTALVSSRLSAHAQQQARHARISQQETEQLYALSRAILLTDSARPIGAQVARSLSQIFSIPSLLLFDASSGQLHRGGPEDWEQPEAAALLLLQEVVRTGQPYHASSQATLRNPTDNGLADENSSGSRGSAVAPAPSLAATVLPITLGGHPIGALAFRGITLSDGAQQSVLNLVAIAFERLRTQEAANRADAARQSEEFKSTLLDAIAHEFKTPLTSIKAAATGLTLTSQPLPPDQRELTSIIEEESDRLSRLVTEAVKMAEIDAGKTAPQPLAVPAAVLLQAACAQFLARGEERLQIDTPVDSLAVWADPDLTELALRQLVDNALKYAPATPVRSWATTAADGRILLCVADGGPGVPDHESSRIFEKFYRRETSRRQMPGTGLGLHIAREIARIQGGDLWVEPARPQGACFCLALPAAPSHQTATLADPAHKATLPLSSNSQIIRGPQPPVA